MKLNRLRNDIQKTLHSSHSVSRCSIGFVQGTMEFFWRASHLPSSFCFQYIFCLLFSMFLVPCFFFFNLFLNICWADKFTKFCCYLFLQKLFRKVRNRKVELQWTIIWKFIVFWWEDCFAIITLIFPSHTPYDSFSFARIVIVLLKTLKSC